MFASRYGTPLPEYVVGKCMCMCVCVCVCVYGVYVYATSVYIVTTNTNTHTQTHTHIHTNTHTQTHTHIHTNTHTHTHTHTHTQHHIMLYFLCRHLQVHKGPVWTAQIKKEVLISGSHDHSVGITHRVKALIFAHATSD